MKPRVRLYAAGQTMFRQVRKDKGYRGAYGMTRSPAKWACITCGRLIDGDDKAPWVAAKAVEDAATEANLAWVAYRPDGWGSNDSDNEALSAFLWALKWLHTRAAELTRDAPSR